MRTERTPDLCSPCAFLFSDQLARRIAEPRPAAATANRQHTQLPVSCCGPLSLDRSQPTPSLFDLSLYFVIRQPKSCDDLTKYPIPPLLNAEADATFVEIPCKPYPRSELIQLPLPPFSQLFDRRSRRVATVRPCTSQTEPLTTASTTILHHFLSAPTCPLLRLCQLSAARV